MKRKEFLKALGTALVVPLPVLIGIPKFTANDYCFTLSEIEFTDNLLNLGFLARGKATLNNSPDGKEHVTDWCFHYIPQFDSLAHHIENELKPMIRSHFVDKFNKVAA